MILPHMFMHTYISINTDPVSIDPTPEALYHCNLIPIVFERVTFYVTLPYLKKRSKVIPIRLVASSTQPASCETPLPPSDKRNHTTTQNPPRNDNSNIGQI